VIFWDSSAVVPLCVDEPATAATLALYQGDREMVVFWTTALECWSAICRRAREGLFDAGSWAEADARLDQLRRVWTEVLATEEVRDQARRLLRRHPLRAADAMQLAAALVWAEGRPEGHALASFDERLCEAAVKEGFAIVPAA
jgi:uncharacterized protein